MAVPFTFADQVGSIPLSRLDANFQYLYGQINFPSGNVSQSISSAGTGTEDRTLSSHFSDRVYLKDFGAVGNGVTDDSAAISAAIASGHKIIDGSGLSYAVASNLSFTNGDFKLVNANLEFQISSGTGMAFSGSVAQEISFFSNAAEDSDACVLNSTTGLAPGQWVFLASDAYWSPASSDNVKYGEFIQIKEISGSNVQFCSKTLLAYNTADSAKLIQYDLLENIQFENVNFYGLSAVGSTKAITFQYCKNVRLKDCNTTEWDHTHISFTRCLFYSVIGGSSQGTGTQQGLDYGVAHSSGCFAGLVMGYEFRGGRHLSTCGGSQGVSRFLSVIGCNAYDMSDAGIDFHAAVCEHIVSDNTISCSPVFRSVSSASWAGGIATVNYTGFYLFKVGQALTVSGITPSGYNATATVLSCNGTSITYAVVSNPGAYSSGGTISNDTTIEGVISQGARPLFCNNNISNFGRWGALWQPLISSSFTGDLFGAINSNVFCANGISAVSAGAVSVSTSSFASGKEISGVTVSSNAVSGPRMNYGVAITALASGKVKGAVVVGNTGKVTQRGIYINSSTEVVEKPVIVGNSITVTGVASNTYAIGLVGTVTHDVSEAIVALNQTTGGYYSFLTSFASVACLFGNNFGSPILKERSLSDTSNIFDFSKTVSRGKPVEKTSSFTVASGENNIVCNGGAQIVITLPPPADWIGREIWIKNLSGSFTVISASSNVVPRSGGAAGTAILPSGAGGWIVLVSDGTSYQAMAGS